MIPLRLEAAALGSEYILHLLEKMIVDTSLIINEMTLLRCSTYIVISNQ
jgi:hypothetical protein